ncbi:hypothetical protein MKW92_028743 [Papaver armeniacum]|nr:hypothetical protein MKW92_028743 [Papaver armeniacum]
MHTMKLLPAILLIFLFLQVFADASFFEPLSSDSVDNVKETGDITDSHKTHHHKKIHHHHKKVHHYHKQPKINCKFACSKRCMKSSRKNVCSRACGTCCERCHCVPPGTYGNTKVCPCYAKLKTHGNKAKCP